MNDTPVQEHSESQDKPVFFIGLMLGVGASVLIAGFFVLGLFTGKYLAERNIDNSESSRVMVLRVENG